MAPRRSAAAFTSTGRFVVPLSLSPRERPRNRVEDRRRENRLSGGVRFRDGCAAPASAALRSETAPHSPAPFPHNELVCIAFIGERDAGAREGSG